MDSAAIPLKSLNKKMDAGKVAKLMKDVAEQQRKTQEVSDAISHTIGFEDDMDYMDEDETLAELEKMEQEDLNKKLLNTEEPAAEPPSVLTETPSIVKAKGTSKKDQDIDPSTEVIQAMDSATSALRSLNKKIPDFTDVGKVANLMKDVTEQQRKTQEVSDALSHTVGFEDDMDYMDEDETLAELEKMEQEDLNKKLSNTEQPAAEPPSVQTETPSIVKAKAKPAEDDEDLTKREALAS